MPGGLALVRVVVAETVDVDDAWRIVALDHPLGEVERSRRGAVGTVGAECRGPAAGSPSTVPSSRCASTPAPIAPRMRATSVAPLAFAGGNPAKPRELLR